MRRLFRLMPLVALLIGLGQAASAGQGYLLDREAEAEPGPHSLAAVETRGAEAAILLLAEGRALPYRWTPPVLEAGSSIGEGIGRLVPLPAEEQGLLALGQHGQDYQFWRLLDGAWSAMPGGTFSAKVVLAAAGHFAAGEGTGLFLQFETGHLAYWQVARDGCLPVWQSPEPWPSLTAARRADLDGDGLDEVLAVGAAGAVYILRWRGGVWENAWTLPPWGTVLGFDLAQTDGQPGLEFAVTTSQRQLFLVGAAGGSFAIRARMTLDKIAPHLALVPEGRGTVLLGDTGGNLQLLVMEGASWKIEARWRGEERLAFLAGLGPAKVLAGTAAGGLRVIRLVPLSGIAVFYDGSGIKNGGLFWDDGCFYLGPDLLRAIGIATKWDEKKSSLTLTAGKVSASMQAGKTDAIIGGRTWKVGRALAMVGKTPYAPADLLSSVFLINVTYDPGAECLILTSAAPVAS
ncbi:MAG: stalk domain-containing protein [Bacteroidota bacterium]